MDTKKSHDYRNSNYTSRRRKVILYKKLTPPRPEMKKFNPLYVDQTNIFDAISICNIAQASGLPTYDGHSSWALIKLNDPLKGVSDHERVGERYSLRYLRLKGYVEVGYKLDFKINYKLLLIRSDMDLVNFHVFLNRFFKNYQFPSGWTDNAHSFADDAQRVAFGRHNYYKMMRNVDNWTIGGIVIRVIADGTITSFPNNTTTTITVGTNPSVETTSNDGPSINAYYPINVNVTVNDDIKVAKERYYYMLVTDTPIGYTRVTGTQGVARSHAYADRAFCLNFFTIAYYTDS